MWDYLISLPWQLKFLIIAIFILVCILMGVFTLRSERRDAKKRKAINPERRYIRVQEVGLAVFLSWPVAIMLATRYELNGIIPAMSVLMMMAALIIFFIGLVGRQELRERETRK